MPSDLQLDKVAERALQNYEDDRIAPALELYAHYLCYRPDDLEATFNYADCLRLIGRKAEAEKEFLKILNTELKRYGTDVRCRLAMLYCDWGRHESAELLWEELSNKRGAPGWVWILRGTNLAAMGNFEDAEICYRKSFGLEGAEPDEAYLNLGYALRAQRRYAEAKDAFLSALDITPDYAEAIAGHRSLEGIDATADFQIYES